ncbi:MAG: na+/H+ antiporter NhaD [Candidatus Bathyarchaeota archaeon B63]|nr:MAG: na+/H+ antiporter NhaD [Candidatus Bathyarchaeota archaeon B63]
MLSSASLIYIGIYILTLLLASTEVTALSVAALIGASLSTFFGLVTGLFMPDEVVEFVDFRVILLLVGVMITFEVVEKSGLFRIIALYAIKYSKGDPRILFFSICFVSAAVSLLLSDVTAILLMAAAAGTIARIMDYDPVPYFVSAAIMINLGGTSTLIGSTSNMIIGVASGLGFVEFLNYLAMCEIALWILTSLTLYLLYRPRLGEKKPPPTYDPWGEIQDKRTIYKASFIIVFFLLLFLLYEHWNVGPEIIAFLSAVLALLVVDVDAGTIFRQIDWETIFFIGGFFIIIGGLDKAGVLAYFSKAVLNLAHGDEFLAALLTLWSSALLSVFVSNIGVALTYTPIIGMMGGLGLNMNFLWSALVLGTNLGGAATPVSGAVCVLTMGALKEENVNLSFIDFSKAGALTTIVQLLFASFYLILMFGM